MMARVGSWLWAVTIACTAALAVVVFASPAMADHAPGHEGSAGRRRAFGTGTTSHQLSDAQLW